MKMDIVSMNEYGLDPDHVIKDVDDLFKEDENEISIAKNIRDYIEENFKAISHNDCEYLDIMEFDLDHDKGFICIEGEVSGEYTYSYNWRDADDFDTRDIDVEFELGEYDCSISEDEIKGITVEVFIRKICLEIYKTFERVAEYESEKDYDTMRHPEEYFS